PATRPACWTSSPSWTPWPRPGPTAVPPARNGRLCAGTWKNCACSCSPRNWAPAARSRPSGWRGSCRRLLDALDVDAGVVALDAQVPGAERALADHHLRVLDLDAQAGRRVHRFPDLAVGEGDLLALAGPAAELALDVGTDLAIGPAAEQRRAREADPVVGHRRGGGQAALAHLAGQPGIERRQLLFAELVQAGRLELGGRHALLERGKGLGLGGAGRQC